MKRNINSSAVLFVLLAIGMLNGACTKKDSGDDLKDNNRIPPVLADNFNLRMFSYAVERGNMKKKLEEDGPFTVLAPSDAAFSIAEFGNFNDLISKDQALITALVRQHIIAGKVNLGTLPYEFNQEMKSMEGKLFVTRQIRNGDTATTINGARVMRSQIGASNGQIQVINRVLQPSSEALLPETVTSDQNISLFAHGLRVSGLLETIRGTGPFTIFAPTNAAMITQGYSTIHQVEQADPETLKRFLSYHILRNRRFVTDFILSADAGDEYRQEMLNGGQLLIRLIPDGSEAGGYSGITLWGAGNAESALLEKRDRVSGNGVLHIINRVLLPAP